MWMIFDTETGNAIDVVYDPLKAAQWETEDNVVVIEFEDEDEEEDSPAAEAKER